MLKVELDILLSLDLFIILASSLFIYIIQHYYHVIDYDVLYLHCDKKRLWVAYPLKCISVSCSRCQVTYIVVKDCL